jgi:hypothetical protein
MGVVYRGRHRLLGQQVAIKFHTLSLMRLLLGLETASAGSVLFPG